MSESARSANERRGPPGRRRSRRARRRPVRRRAGAAAPPGTPPRRRRRAPPVRALPDRRRASGRRHGRRWNASKRCRGPRTRRCAPAIDRFLAELDEADGLLASAAARWERLLADDIDDPEARARLARLRPTADTAGVPVPGRPDGGETLVSPEGVDALRYRLIREIGRGATATVYLARDEGLELPVALKVLHPQLAGARQTEALARFFARRAAGGRRAPPGRGRHLRRRRNGARAGDGMDPGRHLARPPPRARRAACRRPRSSRRHGACCRRWPSCTRAASCTAISSRPTCCCAARAIWCWPTSARRRWSAPGGESGGGTPLYLAPEQLRGAPRAPATDLYAAGAVLFEMAAGRPLRAHADLLRGDPARRLPGGRRAPCWKRAPRR